ncbi:MAG TPA: hypothetical protein VJR69_09240 [Nitrospira sp.]|nr:hypothetical protein [Nitrospira sp.]
MRPHLAACLACTGAILFLLHGEVFAAERTALALAGDGCRPSQQAIVQALEHFDGVARVEADLLPDHLLIDHRTGAVTGEALAAYINTLSGTTGQCHAVVMRSCISAGIEAHTTDTLPSR